MLVLGRVPPPFPLLRDQSGLMIPSPEDERAIEFASLLQRQTLDLKPSHDGYVIMPYDFYCPSVQTDLLSRTCKFCGYYCASKKSAEWHRKALHPYGVTETSRIRPVCMVAQRKREMLCYLKTSSGEEAEWIDVESIDEPLIKDLKISHSSDDILIPVISSYENWLQNPWIQDNQSE